MSGTKSAAQPAAAGTAAAFSVTRELERKWHARVLAKLTAVLSTTPTPPKPNAATAAAALAGFTSPFPSTPVTYLPAPLIHIIASYVPSITFIERLSGFVRYMRGLNVLDNTFEDLRVGGDSECTIDVRVAPFGQLGYRFPGQRKRDALVNGNDGGNDFAGHKAWQGAKPIDVLLAWHAIVEKWDWRSSAELKWRVSEGGHLLSRIVLDDAWSETYADIHVDLMQRTPPADPETGYSEWEEKDYDPCNADYAQRASINLYDAVDFRGLSYWHDGSGNDLRFSRFDGVLDRLRYLSPQRTYHDNHYGIVIACRDVSYENLIAQMNVDSRDTEPEDWIRYYDEDDDDTTASVDVNDRAAIVIRISARGLDVPY